MNPLDLIERYYDKNTKVYRILINHSRCVADKALALAKSHPEMNFDLAFIEEAAMLHDIGMIFCDAPEIGCFGTHHYVCHGFLGAELLRKEGFPRHARVCERHTGTGITRQMIKEKKMPLPYRDFLPVSLEEQIICFADKFFSKTNPDIEKDYFTILKSLSKHGDETVSRFKDWYELFLGQNEP